MPSVALLRVQKLSDHKESPDFPLPIVVVGEGTIQLTARFADAEMSHGT